MKIIDIHTHAQDILFCDAGSGVRPSGGVFIRLFEWGRFRNYPPRRLRHRMRRRVAYETQGRNAMASPEALSEGMERLGITHSVMLPIEPYACTSELISIAKENKRLVPFASVDPCDPKRTEKLRDYVEAGCKGLKLHPIIQDFHPGNPECLETVEEFSQYGLPILFHTGITSYYLPESESERHGDPDNYVKVFSAFPGVKFVMGHMGMFEARKAIDIAQVFENVYFDTSFQPIGMLRRAVDRVGGDRVMFGTDWPFGRQKYELEIVMKLTKGNPWLRDRIFWKNAEELIGEVE